MFIASWLLLGVTEVVLLFSQMRVVSGIFCDDPVFTHTKYAIPFLTKAKQVFDDDSSAGGRDRGLTEIVAEVQDKTAFKGFSQGMHFCTDRDSCISTHCASCSVKQFAPPNRRCVIPEPRCDFSSGTTSTAKKPCKPDVSSSLGSDVSTDVSRRGAVVDLKESAASKTFVSGQCYGTDVCRPCMQSVEVVKDGDRPVTQDVMQNQCYESEGAYEKAKREVLVRAQASSRVPTSVYERTARFAQEAMVSFHKSNPKLVIPDKDKIISDVVNVMTDAAVAVFGLLNRFKIDTRLASYAGTKVEQLYVNKRKSLDHKPAVDAVGEVVSGCIAILNKIKPGLEGISAPPEKGDEVLSQYCPMQFEQSEEKEEI